MNRDKSGFAKLMIENQHTPLTFQILNRHTNLMKLDIGDVQSTQINIF